MSAFSHSVFARDFNKSTQKALLKKGVRIASIQAIPDHDDDQCFAGTAYMLETCDGRGFLRRHEQVICMAKSSWMPEDGI